MDGATGPVEALKAVPPTHNLSEKRAAIAGPSGFKGLIGNKKTFSIGLFASLGGLVYGCMF